MERHDCSQLKVLPLQFPRMTEETHRNSQGNVLRADFFLTRDLTNTKDCQSLSFRHFFFFYFVPTGRVVECLVCYVNLHFIPDLLWNSLCCGLKLCVMT